jgi:hypothetical protein
MQEFFHCRLIPFGRSSFQFRPWSAKAGPAHQVRHQVDIMVTHVFFSSCSDGEHALGPSSWHCIDGATSM